MSVHDLLHIYLNDHLAAANAGVTLFRRTTASHRGTDVGKELTQLTTEAEEDMDALRTLMHRLEIEENKAMTALGRIAAEVGRLKPNGFVVRRSPLADVVELEGLRDAVAGKIAGWQVLRAVAAHDNRVTREELETLLERAQDQAERLYRLHLRVTEQLLDSAEPAA
ncbi:MAG TPA: hypothetical protein VFJ14_00740 [Nocardioidaceae bacterium]|nr:hypothetical protein [Nocardioidaceae bacterium]